MRDLRGIIALDLDGTLLNSRKELTLRNREALERAAAAGWEIVPTTGRFYNAMPACVRELPFIRYAITINGAAVADLRTGETLCRAELPCRQAVEILIWLDTQPVIYDCFAQNDSWMTEAQKPLIDRMTRDPHYRKMLHELRRPVPELKAFLLEREWDVQKIQFFTDQRERRRWIMEELPRRFEDLCVSSSMPDNVEINQSGAHKGAALQALAQHLGVPKEKTLAFGDGLNDLSLLRAAGVGVAMANACEETRAAADWVTASCDEDGVALGIEQFCFDEINT